MKEPLSKMSRSAFVRRVLPAAAAVGVERTISAAMPSIAKAHEPLPAGWPQQNWVFVESGKPTESDQMEPRPILAAAGQVVIIHTGDVAIDNGGVNYQAGEKGGSITIVEGPAGVAQGGSEVWIKFRKRYSSVKVAGLPTGKLDAQTTGRLINTMLDDFRKNNVGTQADVFVPIVNGKTGQVREKRFIPQGQWAVED